MQCRPSAGPYLRPRQQLVSLLGSAGALIPPALGLLALARRTSLAPVLWSLAIFSAVHAWCERGQMRGRTPWRRWPLLWLSALIAPLQALAALLHGSTFTWRGQRIRLEKGGHYTVVESRPSGRST